jgi:sarcosine oxidase subunit beta
VRRENGAEVVVVGAGITGLSVAFFLADRGIRPLVLERRGIAAEASGVQPGGVRQQWSTRVNCLLAGESLAFYRNLGDGLGNRVAARFDACGYLFVAHGRERLDELRGNVALQTELGIATRIVTPDEAAELVPGLDVTSVAGAAWNGDDGYFDRPQTVVEAFASAATGRGARIEIREVRRIEPENERWRVITDAAPVAADAVVVAAGCATPALVEPLGVTVPIEPEARHLFLSDPIRERLLDPLVVSTEQRIAAKQLANGRVLASDLGAAGDAKTEGDTWRQTLARAIDQLLPILRYVSFPVLTGGLYDLTPDRQPLVGEVQNQPGLWVAAGFSGHGFMLAPAVGRRLAAAVAGDDVDELLAPFAPGRFDLGTREEERQVF